MRHYLGMTQAPTEPMTPAYRAVLALSAPIMRRWARLRVRGLDHLPTSGPTLLVANHDSYWDPIAIAVAARHRRPIRALAKVEALEGAPDRLADGRHGPHPDRARHAQRRRHRDRRAGACIGVFPEGTRSLGRDLRARTGAGRLALAVPEAPIVCARVTGTTDVVRLPKRPSVAVEFFLPVAGKSTPGEGATTLIARLLAELRDGAPQAVAGAASHRSQVPRGT
jgi:1-acyl-sn-glycerol-3-phosphate acyltransferase